MAERAGLFEEENDFDVSGFAPKKAAVKRDATPAPEAVRELAERASFPSREAPPPVARIEKREPMRYRTGRNTQFNVKLRADTAESFYDLAKQNNWTLGETVERALNALKHELGT